MVLQLHVHVLLQCFSTGGMQLCKPFTYPPLLYVLLEGLYKMFTYFAGHTIQYSNFSTLLYALNVGGLAIFSLEKIWVATLWSEKNVGPETLSVENHWSDESMRLCCSLMEPWRSLTWRRSVEQGCLFSFQASVGWMQILPAPPYRHTHTRTRTHTHRKRGLDKVRELVHRSCRALLLLNITLCI